MFEIVKALSAIGNTMDAMSRANRALRRIPREDLAQLISNNLEHHKLTSDFLSGFSDQEMRTWFTTKVQPNLTNVPQVAAGWAQYSKSLKGSALREEIKRPLSSLTAANGQFVKTMTQVRDQIDSLYSESEVEIFNLRLTHLAVLGLVEKSTHVANFTSYLTTSMIRLGDASGVDIPKYRLSYITDHANDVARTVTAINDKRGPFTFLREVDQIRKTHADLVLGANGKFGAAPATARLGFYPPYFIEYLLAALSHLNIFQYSLDAWDDFLLTRYERRKETREWMAQHVALLRMDLADMDPHSKEYERVLKIIETYDQRITEYDRKIAEFEKDN